MNYINQKTAFRVGNFIWPAHTFLPEKEIPENILKVLLERKRIEQEKRPTKKENGGD